MGIILSILSVLGSLGIFIFGMKIMSEGIQKIAGRTLRKVLKGMTSHRVMGILTGVITTMLIQSSSATTVMVVSFVNAGLLSLGQAIGVIMGANIGTTGTAWLISILGFGKVKITMYAMWIIGITFPFLFVKKENLRNLAEFILGFGILFIGLDLLKDSVPDIKNNPGILAFLNNYTDLGFLSILIFALIGTILTIVVQSSSASTAITLIMLAEGWIDFPIAAAMILGENIGTTITANIAALVGNIHAKRAARFHSMFNLIGVAWMLILFYPFLNFIDYLTDEILGHTVSIFEPFSQTLPPEQFKERVVVTTQGLAFFHSAFNILNVLLLFAFAPLMEKIVVRLSPSRTKEDEEFKLQYISSGFMSTPELSVEEAQKEVQVFGKLVEKMCANVMMLLFKEPKNIDKLHKKIQKREDITDELQREIATYLSKLGRSELSNETAYRARNMIRMVTDLERMGDIFYLLSLNKKRMEDMKVSFPESVKSELEEYFDLIYKAIKEMNINLNIEDAEDINLEAAYEMEAVINDMRDHLKKVHFDRIEKAKYPIDQGILFLDFVNSAEKLGDHIININQAAAGLKYSNY